MAGNGPWRAARPSNVSFLALKSVQSWQNDTIGFSVTAILLQQRSARCLALILRRVASG